MLRSEFLQAMLFGPSIINSEIKKEIKPTLENILGIDSSKEKITWEQHQKDLKKLIQFYKGWKAEYTKRNELIGLSDDLEITLDDYMFKEYDEWRQKFLKLKGLLEKIERIKKIGKVDTGYKNLKELIEHKEALREDALNPFYVEGQYKNIGERAVIKLDEEKNIFYFTRYSNGKKILDAEDVESNGPVLYTKDYIWIADIHKPKGHEFYSSSKYYRKKGWKEVCEEVASRYKQEIHITAKVVENRHAGKYSLPAKKHP